MSSPGVNKQPFTKEMRNATREIHAISDALVNAKLAFALSDNKVWAEGLLVFYEIFRYLEDAMERLKKTDVGKLDIEGMRRTKAFEDDLVFYLGSNWTDNYQPRESVAKYLLHLQKREAEDPNSLMAYIYHLYMGLLSGGQILAKKRALNNRFIPFSRQTNGGLAVTSFGDKSISKLKRELANEMNSIAEGLDDKTKLMLIEESKKVFMLNNEIIYSIEGTTQILIKKTVTAIAIASVIVVFYYYFLRLR